MKAHNEKSIEKIPESAAMGEDESTLYSTERTFDIHHRMAYCYIEPTSTRGYHAHTFYEINFILSDEGFHYMGNRIIPARRGDVFVIPPHHRHAYLEKRPDFRIYNFVLHPRFFETYLPNLQRLPGFSDIFQVEPLLRSTGGGTFSHVVLRDKRLSEICARLDALHALDQTSEPATLIAACEAMTIIALLCEEYGRTALSVGHTEDAFFAASLALIFERLAEPLSISLLAETAHLSRSAYLRRFAQTTGMSPHRFIRKERIKSAMQLLKRTDMTVARIAEETGFYDISHFARIFSVATGCTPTEYRNNIRKGKADGDGLRK